MKKLRGLAAFKNIFGTLRTPRLARSAQRKAKHRALAIDSLLQLEDRVTPAISYATAGSVYAQDFNTLPSTGTFSPTGTAPIDLGDAPYNATGLGTGNWYFAQISGGTTRFTVDTGAANTGSAYSYGAAGEADRALGFLASGSNISRAGVLLTNDTGTTLTSFVVTFQAETWRRGNDNGSNPNQMAFSYSLGGTDINTGTFVTAPLLDAPATNLIVPDSAVNGNAANARVLVKAAVTGISWAPGQQLVLRWSDANDANNDDGVGIDDLTFSAGGSVVYVNPDWAALTNGDPIADANDGLAGAQAATFGTDAFATLAAAQAAGGANGVIVINAGTYSEPLALTGNQTAIVTETGETTFQSLSGGATTALTINSGARLIVGDATDTTFAGAIRGAGALRKVGAGKLAITSPSTLNSLGNTTTTGSNAAIDVQQGTLEIPQTILTTGRIANVNAGATLSTTGSLLLNTNGTAYYDAIVGSGTVKFAMSGATPTNPDLFFGPNHRSNANYGTGFAVGITVDLGTTTRIVLGRSGNNGVGVYYNTGNNVDAFFRGPIIGSGGLRIISQQTNNAGDEVPFVLNNSNTFSGPLTIDRGSVYLALNSASTPLSAQNDVVMQPGTGVRSRLFLYGTSVTIGNLSSSGAGASGIANTPGSSGAAGTSDGGPATLTVTQTVDGVFGGTINDVLAERNTAGNPTGPLSLVKAGTAKLTLSGDNTFTGTTTINAGALELANTAGSALGTGAVTLNAGGTLAGSGSATGVVSGVGTVSPGGASSPGKLTLGGLSLFNGSASGSIVGQLNGFDAGTGYDQVVVSASGSVDVTNAALTLSASAVYPTGAVITLIDNQGAGSITGTFLGKAEGSTVAISGQNFTISYIGGDGNDITLTKQAPPIRYVDDGWALLPNGSAIVDADLTAPGDQAATIGVNAFATINAAIASVPALGSVIVNDGVYTEAVVVNKQISVVFQSGAITVSSLADTVSNAAYVVSTDAGLAPITLTIGDASSTSLSSNISGPGNLVKQGSGTLTLLGANSSTGSLTVANGVVKIGSSQALSGTASLTVNAPGILQVNGFTVATGVLSGNGIIENAAATSGTLAVGGGNGSSANSVLFRDGVGGGTFSLTKIGTGTMTNSNAASTYTGATTVSAGLLSIASIANGGSPSPIGASSNAAGNLVLGVNATLEYTGSSTATDRSFTLAGNSANSAGSTITVVSPGTTLTINGTATGATQWLTKDGPGTLLFPSSNALNTGNIFVFNGVMGSGSISTSKDRVITISAGAFYDSYGTISTIADPNLTQNIQIAGDGTLRLVSTTNNGVTSYDFDFNANNVAGAATNWGTQISANIDLGSSQRYFTGQSNHNGFGVYFASTDVAFLGSISGSGGITFNARATLRSDMEVPFVFFGSNTFTGPVVIQRGSIYLYGAGSLNGNAVSFDVASGGGGNLFLYGNSFTVSNLTSTGAGTARIANGNRATGAGTPLPAVTLTINQTVPGTFAGILTDAFLEYSNGGSETQGPLSIVKAGPATLTLSGNNTYTGSTTFAEGKVIAPTVSSAGVASSIGQAAGDAANLVFSGGTLSYTGPSATIDRGFTQSGSGGGIEVVSDSATLTMTGIVDGSGAFVKSGPGTLVLAGANTYSGTVNVQAGTLAGTGSATAGATAVAGTLNPGTLAGTGIFQTGGLSFSGSATLTLTIGGAVGGPVAGVDYDQVSSTGPVNLTNATLNLIPGSGSTVVGDTLTIINVAGNNPSDLTGQFTGINPGSFVFAAGQLFQINYHGGDGNDVVLTRVTPPTFYVDDAWAGFANGTPIADADPVAPGNQAAVFGTSAFASPNAAITLAPTGSLIVVNAGSYAEAVALNKAVGLKVQEGPVTFGSLSGNSAQGTIEIAGVSLTIGDASSTQFVGQFLGTGNLIKAGTGSLTLTAASSLNGTFTISNGAVIVGSGSTTLGTSVEVGAAGTLRLNGFSLVLTSLSGAGTIENANAAPVTLTVGSAIDGGFSGVIRDGAGGGALSVVKNGSNTFTLSGSANAYTGSTTINSGILAATSFADAGLPSSVGASSGAAGNLVIQNGATLRYTGAGLSTSNRSLSIGTGGATIEVANAAGTLSLGGQISGGTADFTKSGAGTLIFTSVNAFGTPTTGADYGTITTGKITVAAGDLQAAYLRLNRGRAGSVRDLAISAGASFTANGTIDIDPSQNVYVDQVAGPGTLKLRNPSASKSNPSLTSDAGPTGGDGGPWGTFITATIDVGTGPTQWISGKTNRNDVSRYAGDLRFDSPIVGSANLQFVGLNVNGSRNMHFVLNANNSSFTGGVFVANCDLILSNANALTAANSLTFNSQNDPNTLNRGSLFLYGHSVTIGSLNDISDPATTNDLRNGALDVENGGTNSNNNAATLGVALGLQADSVLTITQTTPGVFNGTIKNGPNDNAAGADGTYRSLAIVKNGAASLTLTNAASPTSGPGNSAQYSGGTTINAGALIVSNLLFSGTGTGDVAVSGGTLGGTGSISGNVVVTSGAVAPGESAGVLSVGGNVDVNSAAQFNVELDGPATFDQLAVTGNVNLNSNGNAAGGATLNLTAATAAVLSGTSYTIVTGASVTGTFRNFDGNELTDGESFVSAGGVRFTIDYTPTSVSLTVAAPTVTGVVPFSGPTSGGQTVIISGTNLGGVSGAGGVKFGGTNATSYTVLSNSSIQAVTPARAAGVVDVIVTNNGQASANTPADNYEYIQGAAAPQFGSFTVNGGDMYAINAYGVQVAGLAGNNSVIEQLYVTFDVGVTLGAGAFTLDAGPVTANIPGGVSPVPAGTNVVTIIAEADPTTVDVNGGHKGYRLRFSGSATYLNTFNNSPTGNGGAGNIFTTLKDGYYKLNIVGANVHAGATVAGTPMASNVTQNFWTMFASYAPDDRSISATPGDGNSIISVNSSVINFANTNGFGYGTSLTGPSGQAYNANFDWNLDGDVGDDLIEFAKRFGAEWAF
jgi:fibronectin-binding autotransporter adhesin